MGIFTVMSGGKLVPKTWPGTTYRRPPFGLSDPSITPLAPSIDIRESATITLDASDTEIPLTRAEMFLDRYVLGEGPSHGLEASDDPIESTAFAQDFTIDEAAPITTVASDVGGTELSLRCRVFDTVGRASDWARSDAETIRGLLDPGNPVLPTISGTGYVGDALTLTTGTWTGTPTPTIKTILTRNGIDVSGTADTTSYTPVVADRGASISWRVWADGFEEVSSVSPVPVVVLVHALRTAPPTISGTGNVGDVLTRTLGTVVGTPTPTMTGNWRADGTNISAATGATYTPVTGDIGKQVTWRDYAVGYETETAAVSNGIGVKAATTDPANVTPPTVSGTGVETSTLTLSRGTWTGTPTPTIVSNWQRDGVDIGGATGLTYVCLHTDIGKTIRAGVWANGFKAQTLIYTAGTVVTASPGPTFPANLTRAQWSAVQTGSPANGSREMRMGTDAGGSAGIVIPADFNLYAMGSTSVIDDSALANASSLVDPSGNDTISLPNDLAVGTLVYHAPVWEHIASGQRKLAHSAADTVTVDGTTGPYGLLKIAQLVTGDEIDNVADLKAAITAAGNGAATIVLKSGIVFEEFYWPSNRSSGTTIDGVYYPLTLDASPLRITSSNPAVPAILSGVLLTGDVTGQFIGLSGVSGRATRVEAVWFDYVTFYGERFDTFQANPKNGSTGVKTITQGGEGFSITVAGVILPSGHPRRDSSGYHESWTNHTSYVNATYGTVGLNVGSGCANIRVTNCEFNGFAHAVDASGNNSNLHVANCRFNENCIDEFKLGTCLNPKFEWNVVENFRTLTKTQTGYIFPPKSNGNPPDDPHADTFQSGGDTDGMIIRYNYLNDSSGQCHFGLLNSGSSGGNQQNFTLINNESRQSHSTGWIISDLTDLVFSYNKSAKIAGTGNVNFNLGGNDNSLTGTRTITNNQAGSFTGQISNGVNGNSTNNNIDTYPSGFTHIRKDDTARAAGSRYAGIGGKPASVDW